MTAAPTWTPQQQAAIETRGVSIALSAGAGCGKTFVLTQRFLSHLAPGASSLGLSGLVAITFTDKAAREMRERIRAGCRQRLRDCPPGEAPHWLEVVREIDAARISTIHSFCGSVLRSSAVEAGLDPQFGLLEPAVADVVLQKSVRQTLRDLLIDRSPAALDVVHEFGLEKAGALLERLIGQRFRLNPADWLKLTPEQLAEHWRVQFQTRGLPVLMQQFRDDPTVTRTLLLLQVETPTHAVMQERRAVLLEELQRLKDRPASITEPVPWMAKIAEQARIKGGGTVKNWSSPEFYEQIKDAFDKLRKALEKQQKNLDCTEADLIPAAALSLQVLELVVIAGDKYAQAKSDAGMLDFDDLLLQTRDLLRNQPEVRRRLANGLEVLLVDEFQDTDPVQAEIVRHLCGAGLITGKLFLVGDAQQSIYRFRRADPEVFRRLRDEIPEPGRLPLNRNFRSQPDILKFTNSLFAGALGDAFQELVPQAQQLSPAPTIEMIWATPTEGEDDQENVETRRRREAQWLARRLRDLLQDEVPRVREKDPATGQTRLRPVQPGDIVLLFRALSDVRYYEEALRECQLEYYLVKGRAFFAQQEVYDVLNLLQALSNPADQVSLLGVLRSPFFGLSDETLMTIALHGQPLSEAMTSTPLASIAESQRFAVQRAVTVWTELRKIKDQVPLAELLQRALDLTGYDASLLLEFLGSRKLANLRKLIDLAREFDQAGGMTLADFASRLQSSVSEETDEELAATQAEAGDVIRLMTIHQSKGLEFPVVVVTDLDRKSQNAQRGTAELHPELGPLILPPKKFGKPRENLGLKLQRLEEARADDDESLRLFYVALTRAADHLILSSGLKDLTEYESTWMKLLADRYDLQSGLPRINEATGQPVIPEPYRNDVPAIRVHLSSPRSPILAAEDQLRGSLSEFREAVAQTEPAAPPLLLLPVPAAATEVREWSVSRLEVWEAEQSQPATNEPHLPAEPEGDLDHTEFGVLLHAALERLNWQRTPDQIPDVVTASWTATLKPIPHESHAKAVQLLEQFWDSHWGAELRSARVIWREADFTLPLPGDWFGATRHVLQGNIDCIYQTADGAWVLLDYKSGFIPTGSRPVWEKYDLQLGVYAWVLQSWLGEFPERVELVYLRPSVLSSGWPISEERIANIQERVKRAIQGLQNTSHLITN